MKTKISQPNLSQAAKKAVSNATVVLDLDKWIQFLAFTAIEAENSFYR